MSDKRFAGCRNYVGYFDDCADRE